MYIRIVKTRSCAHQSNPCVNLPIAPKAAPQHSASATKVGARRIFGIKISFRFENGLRRAMEVDICRIQRLAKTLDEETGQTALTDHVLRQSGLSRAGIAPPATTYHAIKEAQFVRYACDAVNDITFAARAGIRFDESSTLTAYISKYSKNLRQAIENTCYFHWMIDPALIFNLRLSDDSAVFEIDWKDASYSRYHRRTEFLLFAAIARLHAFKLQHRSSPDRRPVRRRFAGSLPVCRLPAPRQSSAR